MDPGTGTTTRSHQRREALVRANRVRLARAALKRRIAKGEVSAADVILFHQWEVGSMPVGDVLTSQRHWGNVRCRRLLTPMRLEEGKTIGSMTERQRRALAAQLRAQAGAEQPALPR
jgi:hypothetical protein